MSHGCVCASHKIWGASAQERLVAKQRMEQERSHLGAEVIKCSKLRGDEEELDCGCKPNSN